MNNGYAIYITSFPPQRYRRPVLAVRALRLLGLKTLLYSGWAIVDSLAPLKRLVKYSNMLPKPLDWIMRAVAYESGLSIKLKEAEPSCIINLNTVGAYSLRRVAEDSAPLILDMQDVTIEDNETIPLSDRLWLREADLVIFASRAIKQLAERNHGGILAKTAYIPFGIDLEPFDQAYTSVEPKAFKNSYNLSHKIVVTYSGGAYLWGRREGQGLELLMKAVVKTIRYVPELKLVIQGAAAPGTHMWFWIREKIREHRLEGKVLLIPPTSPLDPLRLAMVKASDVLLLPIGDILGTYYATQQKLFEYMAASRPIAMVATPARLSVLDDSSAYIASSRDPEEFADQIIRAIEEPVEASAKATRARKTVEEKYDWKVLIPKYAEVIAPILQTS